MKTIALLIFALFIGSTTHAGDFRISCGTQRESLSIWSEGEKVYLAMANSEGFAELPVYTGPVTANNISYIKEGFTDLKELNGNIMVSWDKSMCKQDPATPMLMTCNGPGQLLVPKTSAEFQTFTLSTALGNQKTLDYDYNTLNINWGVDTGGLHYLLTFSFGRDFCRAK